MHLDYVGSDITRELVGGVKNKKKIFLGEDPQIPTYIREYLPPAAVVQVPVTMGEDITCMSF